MKVYITYDNTSRKLKSVQVHYNNITLPDLPAEAGVNGVNGVTIEDTEVDTTNFETFLRNFDRFEYSASTAKKVILTGVLDARYIPPVGRDESVPKALSRANTVTNFGVL